MNMVISLMTIALPGLMVFIKYRWKKAAVLYHLLAVICSVIAGINISITTIQVILHNQVFTTAFHGIFINLWFILSSAYLIMYLIYSLIERTWISTRNEEAENP